MTRDPPGADCSQLWEIIQTSRNKLKAAFDAIADPVCSVTPDPKVKSLNLALALLAGQYPRDLVGLELAQVLERAAFLLSARQEFLEQVGMVAASCRAQASLGAEDLLRMIMNLLDIDCLEKGRFLVSPEHLVFQDLA